MFKPNPEGPLKYNSIYVMVTFQNDFFSLENAQGLSTGAKLVFAINFVYIKTIYGYIK